MSAVDEAGEIARVLAACDEAEAFHREHGFEPGATLEITTEFVRRMIAYAQQAHLSDGSSPKASLRDQLRVAREALTPAILEEVASQIERGTGSFDHPSILRKIAENQHAALSLLPKEGEK